MISKEEKKTITKCIENAFNATLIPSYWEDTIDQVFIESNGNGVLVIKKLENNISLIDKFAVVKEKTGTGLGKQLWLETIKKTDKYIWRCSPNNPFLPFYINNSDGHENHQEWIVFWVNLTPKEVEKYSSIIITKPSYLDKNK